MPIHIGKYKFVDFGFGQYKFKEIWQGNNKLFSKGSGPEPSSYYTSNGTWEECKPGVMVMAKTDSGDFEWISTLNVLDEHSGVNLRIGVAEINLPHDKMKPTTTKEPTEEIPIGFSVFGNGGWDGATSDQWTLRYNWTQVDDFGEFLTQTVYTETPFTIEKIRLKVGTDEIIDAYRYRYKQKSNDCNMILIEYVDYVNDWSQTQLSYGNVLKSTESGFTEKSADYLFDSFKNGNVWYNVFIMTQPAWRAYMGGETTIVSWNNTESYKRCAKLSDLTLVNE